jgi:pyruvate formate lyase activating enzyme
VNIDPVEKKPLLHFLPSSSAFSIATAGCNLACLNCQNWTISQSSPLDTENYELMPQAVVDEAVRNKCKSIAYTYSEPITFFEYTYDTCRIARTRGIRNILVSAGYINDGPLREFAKNFDAANIDLKSFSEQTYLKLNGGSLKTVLNTLLVLKEMNVWLEITNLVVPEWTDDLKMITQMCTWLKANGFENYPLHFSRFHPQYKLTRLPATPVSVLEKARDIAINAGLKFVYMGNVSGTEASDTFCPKCKKLIVERKGFTVISNNIKIGKCGFCGEKIPGAWS